uniref:Phosphatidate cytidylyltransferase n=1 Tax=Aquifex pyrophilus TaxID=2714 RepID=Q8GLL0_AQUPY|nr:phosphatidate cytidylytransferase [Aquifex pyrophilus]
MSRESYGLAIGLIVILITFLPLPLFAFFVCLLSFFVSKEVSKVFKEDISLFSPLILLVHHLLSPLTYPLIGLLALYRGYKTWSIESFLKVVFLGFYPALFLSYLIGIREKGVFITLVFIFGIWINDVFAYYTGKYFGKTPLFPKISPKKTLEGLLGGLIPASLFYGFLLPEDFLKAFFIGMITLVFGVAGDYFKSFIKRQYHIKDFSNILGEHGGFADRFDAIIFSSPVFYFFIN